MRHRFLGALVAATFIITSAAGAAGPPAPANRSVEEGRATTSKRVRPAGTRTTLPQQALPAQQPMPPGNPVYDPPGGRYYRPPPPPPGGWRGGYYPPPVYVYHDSGPSAGEVIAGVAVTGTLLAVLANASKPKTSEAASSAAPPPPPPPFVPPPGSTGKPAKVDVNLGGLLPDARPSASTCLAEASRQIGATGGLEIGIASFDKVEPGNGGYRFTLTLLATYPDAKRKIPMYCRATPTTLVELRFG